MNSGGRVRMLNYDGDRMEWKEKAEKIVNEMCEKLLTNTVIEDYKVNFK